GRGARCRLLGTWYLLFDLRLRGSCRRRCDRRRDDLLPRLADPRDRLADGRLPLRERDLQQHAREVGLDLLGDLVGVDLEERLALLDGLALALQPLADGAGLHPLAEPRQLDLGRHRYLPTARRIAARTSAGPGTTYCSITGANARGAKRAPTRSIGASR